MNATPGAVRAERGAVGRRAAARRRTACPANLWKVGRNDERPQPHARAGRSRRARAAQAWPSRNGAPTISNGRVVPRPSDRLVALDQAHARVDQRGVERRHVGRRHHPGQPGVARRSSRAASRASAPPSGRSRAAARSARRPTACRPPPAAPSRRSSARAAPGQRPGPTNDSQPSLHRPALDRDAAERVRPIEDDAPRRRRAPPPPAPAPSSRRTCSSGCRRPGGRRPARRASASSAAVGVSDSNVSP